MREPRWCARTKYLLRCAWCRTEKLSISTRCEYSATSIGVKFDTACPEIKRKEKMTLAHQHNLGGLLL